ncbi:MAG: hypothetical protein SGCHY_000556 [Lobulomycetales sp.]
MNSPADEHKAKGNALFKECYFKEAISEYTRAIIVNPINPIYFTNRSLTYSKLDQWRDSLSDAEKAIQLDPKSVKGHYLAGQALLHLGERLNEASSLLSKAYQFGAEQKVAYIEDILNACREAKKRRYFDKLLISLRWQMSDEKRRSEESDMYRYLKNLMEREKDRQLQQVDNDEARDDVMFYHSSRVSELDELFARAGDSGRKREVPDYLMSKISFELLTDPVVTPGGITYDRPEIVTHLQKIGKFDPITRAPLHESQLIPNLALKECVEEFTSKNGWAVDY